MIDAGQVRGFNYEPGYAYTGADIWRYFDAEVFDRELGWGKKHFPKMNGIRIWLAWEVYALGSDAEKERFLDSVATTLDIAEKYDLVVMPVLFNRWHAGVPDWGGVYLDHILPGAGWAGRSFTDRCRDYVSSMVRRFRSDSRVFAWDLCNEPFSYGGGGRTPDPSWNLEEHEAKWLRGIYSDAKEAGAEAPLSVGFHAGPKHLKRYDDLNDILNFHRYWQGPRAQNPDPDAFRRDLDECVELREKTGKPLISSEAGWGSTDDAERVEILEFHLDELNKRNIGWLIHALAHSHVADIHREEGGPVANPGIMHCVETDGSLRPHHERINEYL
jgi:endo-1,4-beta-mannosidase